MRPRPHTINPEDEERIAAALAAPIEERPKPPRLDVSSVLAKAKPTGLRPVVANTNRRVRDEG